MKEQIKEVIAAIKEGSEITLAACKTKNCTKDGCLDSADLHFRYSLTHTASSSDPAMPDCCNEVALCSHFALIVYYCQLHKPSSDHCTFARLSQTPCQVTSCLAAGVSVLLQQPLYQSGHICALCMDSDLVHGLGHNFGVSRDVDDTTDL